MQPSFATQSSREISASKDDLSLVASLLTEVDQICSSHHLHHRDPLQLYYRKKQKKKREQHRLLVLLDERPKGHRCRFHKKPGYVLDLPKGLNCNRELGKLLGSLTEGGEKGDKGEVGGEKASLENESCLAMEVKME